MGCWSPDGKWIYLGSNRSGIYQIWRMPATGGEAQQITQHGADAPLLSVDGKVLYFNKGSELFAIPSAGGEERKIVDSVSSGAFTVTRNGIYCIREKDGRNELCSLDPLTLKSRMLTVLEGNIFERLTASPDGKTILYVRSKESGTDLMLVENFR